MLSQAIQPSWGNETDQFLLPVDVEFADIGPLLSLTHYQLLEDLVTRTNEKIRRVKQRPDSPERQAELKRLHSPVMLANYIRGRFGPGFFETLDLERILRSQSADAVFENQIAAFKTPDWIYEMVHLPIDPRKIPLAIPSSTIRVADSYFGTDKLAHFHDLGHIYFKDYSRLRRNGVSEEEAVRRVVRNYSRGPISEAAVIGFFATGIFSNADLAANYQGFKFYRNMTEPVQLNGSIQPPLLVLIGDYWSLNQHVRPESNFFNVYISDHMNEALNPCLYEWGARGPIAKKLKKHANQILTFYADENGKHRPRAYFEDYAQTLSTYYGENYGHSGFNDNMVTIATCCFAEESDDSEVKDNNDP